MTDVLPARALGPAEYWGRVIENRLRALEKKRSALGQALTGQNRHHASSSADLARRVIELDERLEQIEAAYNLIPGSDSTGTSTGGFGLNEGWNTVAQTTLAFPAGKSQANVFARGVVRVADYGEGTPVAEGFMLPFPSSTISSPYGPRSGGAGSFHEGTDFAPGAGTGIPAIGDGYLERNEWHSNFGNMAIINHGTVNGQTVRSLYAHMVSPSPLAIGDPVSMGSTIIGGVGNTGASFGAHLHLEVHVGPSIVWNTNNNGGYRSAVDPVAFISGNPGGGGGVSFSTYFLSRLQIAGGGSRDFAATRQLYTVGTERVYHTMFPIHGRQFSGSGSVPISFEVYAPRAVSGNGEMSATIAAFGVFS